MSEFEYEDSSELPSLEEIMEKLAALGAEMGDKLRHLEKIETDIEFLHIITAEFDVDVESLVLSFDDE